MGTYEDFINGLFGSGDSGNALSLANPLSSWFNLMENLWENSHGGSRAAIESLPFSGSLIKWKQSIKKAEDHYQNTGTDSVYGYNTPVNPLLRDLSSGVTPVKMARSLTRMYGAEVELDIAKERHATWESSRKAAQSWQQYERMKRDRYDKYGQ